MPTTTLCLAALALLLALPGLLLHGEAPFWSRLAALLALLGLGLGILDLHETTTEVVTPVVAVVPTAAKGAREQVAELRRQLGEGVRVQAVPGQGRLRQRLNEARLQHRDDPELVLLWTGAFDPSADISARTGGEKGLPDVTAISATKPAPIDPDRISLRQLSPFQKGRPGALELRLGSLPSGLQGRLRVLDPEGGLALEKELVFAGQNLELAFEPIVHGIHQVQLQLRLSGFELRGQGHFTVHSAAKVTVVGRGAAQLARALKVQGLRVEQAEDLPEQLDGVVVLLDPVPPTKQARVLDFVDSGGGLFFVGGRDGGALPGATQILHGILPVNRLPWAGQDPKGEGTERPLPEREPKDKSEENPEGPATGDTSDARLPEKPEKVEVERRSIAMVLVIDRSGSMEQRVQGTRTRMDLAKAGAWKAAQALEAGDELGIVTFGNKNQGAVVLPLTQVTALESIRQALSKLSYKREGTFLADALGKAQRLLEGSRAAVRHVVVITDGEIYDVDHRAPIAARELDKAGCTFSLIQVLAESSTPGLGVRADSASSTRKLVEQVSGGTFIKQTDFSLVPQLISVEVQKSRNRLGRKPPGEGDPDRMGPQRPEPEKPEPAKPEPPEPELPRPAETPQAMQVRAVIRSRLLEPRPEEGYPQLGGICPVRGRREARVLLVAGQEGVPLLAFANRGLGKVGVWSSDLLGTWGRDFRAHAAFPAWLAQWVQSLQPARAVLQEPLVLSRPELRPEAPTPLELAAMQTLGATELTSPADYEAPRPHQRQRQKSLASEHARVGFLLLALLVLVEFLLARTRTGRDRQGARA